MSKKKAPKGAFHGSTGGFFLQKKKVVLGNIKHLGNEKNISLNKSELDNNVFSDVDSVSGDEKSAKMTGINVGSLLDSTANTPKAKCINTGAIFSSLLGSPNFVMDDDKNIFLPLYCYHNNKFKVATTPDTATLEYYQSIYTHCKQRFNIPDEIEVVKKSVYQYIENCINNYLFKNYNISEVRSNLYNNLVHYSQLGTEDLNSETLATYFQELNFNILSIVKKNTQYKTETSNKGKQRLKQYSKTTSNTPTLQKTPAKHLQTPEQRISVKLPLSITLFPISLVQPQTPSSPLSHFSRPEDFHANIIDYLQENESNHSESLESKETESEPEEITENKEEMTTAYIAKIPKFTGEDNDTSFQEWLDKVQKARDANSWIAAKMLKAIPYFLQGTAGE
ncbi:hypothetical protein G9A89_016730 [Geosiphon pyriformis]|nr:hypothetical protein G9A89_016730 [Geosiphon pyriformis]